MRRRWIWLAFIVACTTLAVLKVWQNEQYRQWWRVWGPQWSAAVSENITTWSMLDGLKGASREQVSDMINRTQMVPIQESGREHENGSYVLPSTGSTFRLSFRDDRLVKCEVIESPWLSQYPVWGWLYVERARWQISYVYGTLLWLPVVLSVVLMPRYRKTMAQLSMALAILVAECRVLDPPSHHDFLDRLIWWSLPRSLAQLGVSVAILLWVFRRRTARSEDPLCNRCGYNLAGLGDARCPECGTPFDPKLLQGRCAENGDRSENATEEAIRSHLETNESEVSRE
jgi:hypothetical protein